MLLVEQKLEWSKKQIQTNQINKTEAWFVPYKKANMGKASLL